MELMWSKRYVREPYGSEYSQYIYALSNHHIEHLNNIVSPLYFLKSWKKRRNSFKGALLNKSGTIFYPISSSVYIEIYIS